MRSLIRIVAFTIFIAVITLMVQPMNASPVSEPDSTNKAKQIADEAKVKSTQHDIQINIQNVDITRFPEVRLIVGASNVDGFPLDSIVAQELTVVENGKPKKVLSVQRISVKERIPIDFIFIIDITGTMQTYINGVKNNIEKYVESLLSRGIVYGSGLVVFSVVVERAYHPTDNVQEFLKWISTAEASV